MHSRRQALIGIAGGILTSATATFSGTSRAYACSYANYPTPLEEQRAFWNASRTVFLARIDRLRPFSTVEQPHGRRGVLVPLEVLKGTGPIPWVPLSTRRVTTSCDSQPPALQRWSTNGELFVVFSRDRGRNVSSEVRMVRRINVVEPRVLARLR